MLAKLKALDRNRLGIIGIALAIVLFLAVNILSGVLFTSARLDLTEDRLFTLSDGTRQGALEHRGADRSALLLHQPAGRARAVFQQLRKAGRGAARRVPAPVPGQAEGRAARPAAVLPRGGSRGRRGSGGPAAQRRRRPGLFRPVRAQQHRRHRGDQLSGAGARQLPGVRPDPPGQRPRQPREARGRGAGRSAADGQPVQPVPALARPAGDVPVLRRALPGRQAGPDRRGRPGPDARPAAQRRPGDALRDRPVRDARRPGAGVRRSARRGHGGGRRHEPDGQSRGRRDRRARAAARGVGRGDLERPGDRRSHRGATRERPDRRPPGGDRLSALAQPRFEPPQCRRRDHRRHPAGQSQLRRLDPRAAKAPPPRSSRSWYRASCRWRSRPRRSAPRPIRPS